MNGNVYSLYIKSVKREQAGKYYCYAINKVAHDQGEISVIVNREYGLIKKYTSRMNLIQKNFCYLPLVFTWIQQNDLGVNARFYCSYFILRMMHIKIVSLGLK